MPERRNSKTGQTTNIKRSECVRVRTTNKKASEERDTTRLRGEKNTAQRGAEREAARKEGKKNTRSGIYFPSRSHTATRRSALPQKCGNGAHFGYRKFYRRAMKPGSVVQAEARDITHYGTHTAAGRSLQCESDARARPSVRASVALAQETARSETV